MNYNNPYVSIGLPVYNREKYIRATLESLLAQTFTDFELIISDNASTDRTHDICMEYASKDPRIRYYRNAENRGAAWNYNRVFELAVGKYFKWAASDDLCAPDFVLRCVETLDQNPSCVLCFPRTTIIDELGNNIGYNDGGLNITSSSPHERYRQFHDSLFRAFAMIRPDVLKATPLIGSYEGSDMTLAAELALRGQFCEIPELLFFQRDHPENSTVGNESRPDKIAVWFDPKNKGKIVFPRWRWFFEYIRSINRVEMSAKEKALCYIQMGNWVSHFYRGMVYDLIAAVIVTLRLSDNPNQFKHFIMKILLRPSSST